MNFSLNNVTLSINDVAESFILLEMTCYRRGYAITSIGRTLDEPAVLCTAKPTVCTCSTKVLSSIIKKNIFIHVSVMWTDYHGSSFTMVLALLKSIKI